MGRSRAQKANKKTPHNANSNVVPLKQSTEISCRNQSQRNHHDAMTNPDNAYVIATGEAGGGRTYMSTAVAVQLLKQDPTLENLVIMRPAVEAEEKLGFLPGGRKNKIDPYFAPIYNTFEKIGLNLPEEDPQKGSHTDTKTNLGDFTLEAAPIGFTRGCTFDNAIILLDEAQNTTMGQAKLVLGRLGENSRMFINGDLRQCDLQLNNGDINGLQYLLNVHGLKNQSVGLKTPCKHFAFVRYDPEHIVRSEGAKAAIMAFAAYDTAQN